MIKYTQFISHSVPKTVIRIVTQMVFRIVSAITIIARIYMASKPIVRVNIASQYIQTIYSIQIFNHLYNLYFEYFESI